MNAKQMLCVAALPVAVLLSGCESAPIKSVQKMFGSGSDSDAKTATSSTDSTNTAPGVTREQRAAPAAAVASRGASDLQLGVARYEDGQYSEASTRLQAALAAGLTPPESVRAHKYLAFMHCASKRERQCRSEFRKAIAIDPGFQLNAAEAGHPIWGRIFRDVKQRG